MDIQNIIYFVFAAVLLSCAIAVVTARNPVHSALFLIASFFSAAGIWIMLQAEFLGILLILVYVGAVMVLFLFVVMLLDINLDRLREGFWSYLPLGAIVALLVVAEMGLVLASMYGEVLESDVPQATADYSNVEAVGRLLFTEYVYPFELASVVLLIGVIAAVALTLRGKRKSNRSVRRSRFLSRPRIAYGFCRCRPRKMTESMTDSIA